MTNIHGNKKKTGWFRRFIRHLRKTYRNKLTAIAMFLFGLLPMIVVKEGTIMLLMLPLSIMLWFAKEDIYDYYK